WKLRVAEDAHQDRSSADSVGAAAALCAAADDPALREQLRRYLDRQSQLAAIQIKDALREDKVRHWSLRVRHISDVFKLSFEFGAALVFLTLAGFIGLALWTAAHDRALVIETFYV